MCVGQVQYFVKATRLRSEYFDRMAEKYGLSHLNGPLTFAVVKVWKVESCGYKVSDRFLQSQEGKAVSRALISSGMQDSMAAVKRLMGRVSDGAGVYRLKANQKPIGTEGLPFRAICIDKEMQSGPFRVTPAVRIEGAEPESAVTRAALEVKLQRSSATGQSTRQQQGKVRECLKGKYFVPSYTCSGLYC